MNYKSNFNVRPSGISSGFVEFERNVVYPELIENGNFSQLGAELTTPFTSGWNQIGSNGWSLNPAPVNGGLEGIEATNYVYQGLTTAIGKQYQVVVDATVVDGSCFARGFNANNIIDINVKGRKTYSAIFSETDTNTNFGFSNNTEGGFTGTIHSVSVKEFGVGWEPNANTTLVFDGSSMDIQSLPAGGIYGAAATEVNFKLGKQYLIKINVVSCNQPNHIRVGGTNITSSYSQNIWASGDIGIGTSSIVWTAIADFKYISVGGRNDVTTLKIDFLSVKEVGEATESALPNQSECEAYGYTWNSGNRTCQAFNPSITLERIAGNLSNNLYGSNNKTQRGTQNSMTIGDFNSLNGSTSNNLIVGRGNSIERKTANNFIVGTAAKSIVDNSFSLGGNNGVANQLDRLGAQQISNPNFDEISDELVLNGDFSEEGVEEVVNGDFTQLPLGTGWDAYTTGSSTVAFTEGAILSIDGSNSNVGVYQQNIFTNGVQYKIIVSVKATASFDAEIVESQGAATQTTIGTVSLTTSYQDFVFYFTGTGTNDLFIHRLYGETAGQNQQIYIKEVSVKQVDRDNVPRIDYTGGGCPHILAEPQRKNELLQSNQFDTTWNQSGTLTSGQDGVGGSTDAWKFENPNATSSLYQTDTTSGVQTVSAYFKKNSNYGVRFFAFGSVNCSTFFDLNNGAVVSVINSTAKVESAGADWFRCSMTFDQTTSRCDFYVTNNASTQVLGDYTIQYAQLEEGSYATSYIPTSGSTVTRNQDIFTRDGIGSLINSTEGVLFAEIAALSDDGTYRYMGLTDGNSDNRVIILYYNSSTRIRVLLSSGGTKYFDAYYAVTSIEDFHKVALKWKENDFALWIDGVERATDTSGLAPIGLNTVALDQAGGDNFYGKVKQLQVYDTALTDEQLLQLTGESGTDFYESYAEMASALTYTIQ